MKILDTEETTHQFRVLIKEANEFLIIICPYMGLKEQSRNLFEKSINRVTYSYIISRLEQNQSFGGYKETEEFFKGIKSKNIGFGKLSNLHAKIYMNEKECLITSYNLIDSTKDANYEVGVQISKELNPEGYYATQKIALEIVKKSDVEDKSFANLMTLKDLSIGMLYNKLTTGDNFNLVKSKYKSFDSFYRDLCNLAREHKNFGEDDFQKTDRSRLYRHTKLTMKEFLSLYNKLIQSLSDRK